MSDEDVKILKLAADEIERHTGWRQDSYDEEPYPATDDDYRKACLAGELRAIIERQEASQRKGVGT